MLVVPLLQQDQHFGESHVHLQKGLEAPKTLYAFYA